MSDSDNENKDLQDAPEDLDGDIDEELLAMAGPPPSLKYGLFTAVVVVLLFVMMAWFFPELQYALKVGDEPTPLGEAANIDLAKVEANSFVSIDGLPMVSRGIEYKEGIRWFSLSDNIRHFFPLTGQPNIYVQWKEPDEYKAFRDPDKNPTKLGPPSHFEGHLVKREDLVGANFERILVFYDCLKVHPLRRCNACLGKPSLDLCREYFTCVERNKADECVTLVKHLENPDAVSAEDLTISLRDHRIEVELMRLEEQAMRTARLERNSDLIGEDKVALNKLKEDILAINVAELKVRASVPYKHFLALSDSERVALEAGLVELEKAREQEKIMTERQKLLNEYAAQGQALEDAFGRLGKLKVMVEGATAGSLDALGKWDVDPATKESKKLCQEIDRLEAFLFTNVEKQEVRAESPESPKTLAPGHEKIVEILSAIRTRLKTLQSKIAGLEPGASKSFDKWARKPDVFGAIPAELKDTLALMSIGKIEDMLAEVSVSEDSFAKLIERVNTGIDEVQALKKEIEQLNAKPGMREVEVSKPIAALEENAKKGGDIAKLTLEVGRITLLLMEKKLYQSTLAGMPDEMTKLEKIAGKNVVASITARVDDISSRFEKGDWILFDKDPPLEKTWVLLVYAVLCVMVVINTRKLWRFYSAWKS